MLIIGTSLTAGYGLDLNDAYPARIQHIADSLGVPAQIVGAGLSGETSAGALRRANRLLDRPATIVIIETGANDGLRGLDPDSLEANLRGLIALIRGRLPGARIVLAQMEAPRNFGPGYLKRFHDAFENVARSTNVVLMPFFLDGVAGVPAMNQDDGIHPNENGAKRAAENAWQTLGPMLRAPVAGRGIVVRECDTVVSAQHNVSTFASAPRRKTRCHRRLRRKNERKTMARMAWFLPFFEHETRRAMASPR